MVGVPCKILVMFSIGTLQELSSQVGVPCKILVMFSSKWKRLRVGRVGVPCKILVMFSQTAFLNKNEVLEYPAKF